MQTDNRFSPDVVALLDQTDEVRIEPASADGQPMQPVIIWVVVLDGPDVYVRSYRGVKGRWYQQLLKQPQHRGRLHVDQRAIPVRAVHIDDPEIIARVSDAFRKKYESKWPQETAEMLRADVLPTTLRLEPDTT